MPIVFVCAPHRSSHHQWRDALTHAALYLVLAPFDAEVSDTLQRIKAEKKLADLPSCERAYALFTTHELCAWPLPFDAEWRAHPVFQVRRVPADAVNYPHENMFEQ